MPAVSNLTLFAACVAIWSTTWFAITFQLGPVAAEVSVAWRFMLAGLMVAAYCRLRGLPLALTAADHAALALMGITMFSASYICVYHAEKYLASGLVAVGFSAGPLLAMFGMRLFFGQPLTSRMAIGSLLGIVGIVLVFWPEFARLSQARGAELGALLTVAAVVVSTVGGLLAHRNHTRGLHGLPAIAWSMGYGGVFALAVALVLGRTLAIETTPAYLLSLNYLVAIGSVAAFVAWLTLIGRIGPARASYVGVMVPVIALIISTLFENLPWHPLMIAGMVVSVVGNVLVLRDATAAA
jgi:drug/metabolite transporter (DMT)-like permease